MKKNKYIIVLSISITILIIGTISHFIETPDYIKYEYLDLEAKTSIGLPLDIFYKQIKLFSLNGWESKLIYDNKEKRISGKETSETIISDSEGNNYIISESEEKIILKQINQEEIKTSIGWFTNNNFEITENEKFNAKEINIKLINSNQKANFKSDHFKRKPYFKIQFTTNTTDNSKLGLMAYGFNLNGHDIYLPNGEILENDNKITELNENKEIILNNTIIKDQELLNLIAEVEDINKLKILREGSTHELKDINYEIFHNEESKKSIIIYGENIEKFKNSFYWNVHWVYVNEENGIYEPIYFIILEDSELDYNNQWNIKSKYYNGELTNYIKESVEKMKNE
jgi:hypothetical protein